MNTLKITKNEAPGGAVVQRFETDKPANYKAFLLLGLMILLWPMLQRLIGANPAIGSIDPNIWLLVLLSLICFLLVTGLCWWLLQQFWISLGLPATREMVLSFKKMELWKQLGFFWLSFALLLLTGVLCLTAIC